MKCVSRTPRITPRVKALLAQLPPRSTLAFDADGTIWRNDVGEVFATRMAQLKRYGGLRDHEMKVFPRWLADGSVDMYDYMSRRATAVEGLTVAYVDRCVRELILPFWSRNIRPEMRAIIEMAHADGHRVVVASASARYLVEPCVKMLGIESPDVCAVDVAVEKGTYLGIVFSPTPYADGKVAALRTIGVKSPAAAFGDSDFDIELLSWATNAAVALNPRGPLLARVRKMGWQQWRIA